MAMTIEQIAEELDKLPLLQAAQLSKMLQEKWGVSAAAPVAVAAASGAAGRACGGRSFEECARKGGACPPPLRSPWLRPPARPAPPPVVRPPRRRPSST